MGVTYFWVLDDHFKTPRGVRVDPIDTNNPAWMVGTSLDDWRGNGTAFYWTQQPHEVASVLGRMHSQYCVVGDNDSAYTGQAFWDMVLPCRWHCHKIGKPFR